MFVLLSPSTVPVPFPLPPSKESIIPKDVNFLVGYEAGHRLTEPERRGVRFARVEQLEQWFLASAPGNPVLLRCLVLWFGHSCGVCLDVFSSGVTSVDLTIIKHHDT